MPRTTKGIGYCTTKGTTQNASRSQESRIQTRSLGLTVAGQKRRITNPGEGASWSKRGHAVSQDTKARNEAPTMLLTQADIPQIVEAVLNNLLALHETTHDNDSHTENNLDLCHVSLIPRNSEGTSSRLNHPVTGTSYQAQSMLTGAAIPPVLPGLVEKIKSGVFVDMGDLVPHRLGFEEITRSKQKRQAISSISE